MALNPIRYIQFKVINALAPMFAEGSELDTIFWSYDDWREARERVFAARAKKMPATEAIGRQTHLNPKDLG